MVVTLVLLGFVIATSLAGEVAQTGYSPKPGYDWYYPSMNNNNNNNDMVEIGQTPRGHKFYLTIYYHRRYVSSYFSCLFCSRITSYDFQNIVLVYYDSYLLEDVEVPRIDTLDDPLKAIDRLIIDSFIPEMPVPEQDVDAPDKITVYYLFTNDKCVKAVYTYQSYMDVYEKTESDQVVDPSMCTHAT